MNKTIEISDLYRLALRYEVQIRRLNFKRDSLEDIFLKAMENGEDNMKINSAYAVENVNERAN